MTKPAITFELRHQDVFPEHFEPGKLYISKRFALAGHLCPCGCGAKICVLIADKQTNSAWQYSEIDNKATLHPSLLNMNCPNKAHYFIRDNSVVWC